MSKVDRDAVVYNAAVGLNIQAEAVMKEAVKMHQAKEPRAVVMARVRKAHKYVSKACIMLESEHRMEPARSQLFFNAAKLAESLTELDLADEYIARALSGAPPEDMRVRLEMFRRQLCGIKTAPAEERERGPLN